jgi:hypothetical protein
MSPTQKALKYFRDRGGVAVVLERYVHHAKRRFDIWGADILVRRGQRLIAVQATDGTSHGKHIAKALADPNVLNWLWAGVTFYIYSESQRGPRGEAKVWTPRITQVLEGDVNGQDAMVTVELGV